MTALSLTEALVALMRENTLAERHLADRQVVRQAGEAALAGLFGAPEPPAEAPAPEPVTTPQSAPEREHDWTEVDAQVAAMKAAETSLPAASEGAPPAHEAVGLSPEESAFMAALNAPQTDA